MLSEQARGQRLPPISLLFGVLAAAKSFLVPAVVVVVASGRPPSEAWLAVFFLPVVISSFLRYVSFTYWLGPEEMVIREGILRRNERHIPYARIQNIDLVQGLVHRAFDVATVRLETASGGKPEAEINVLTTATIEDMRARVFRQRAGAQSAAATSPEAGTPLLQLSLGELAIFGVVSNKGMVIVAAILGLYLQSGNFDDPELMTGALPGEAVPGEAQPGEDLLVEDLLAEDLLAEDLLAGDLLGDFLPSSGLNLALFAVGGLIALLLGLRIFSVAWAIFKFFAFRLEQIGEDLRAEYGLLTRITATIPRHRIQLVTVNLTLLHRLFGRASIQVDTAGSGSADGNRQGAAKEQQWLAPIIHRDRALRLLRKVLPESRLEGIEWQPLAPRAWLRLFRKRLVLLLLVSAAGFALLGSPSLVVVLLGAPLAYFHARLYARRSGYALTPAAVLYRSGCWIRRVSIVPFAKIQVLALRQTPFDRRNKMASVHVDTAGATAGGHRVAIDFLEIAVAREVMERLDLEAARTAFKW